MRAYVYRLENEREKLPGLVTPEYKTLKNMYRFYLRKHLPKGSYKVHLHHNWNSRYKAADLIFTVEI